MTLNHSVKISFRVASLDDINSSINVIEKMTQNCKPLILIPARMGAMRLPNKPMALIDGIPMIEHVCKRAMQADIGPVYVATPDQVIFDHIEKNGGKAIMTSIDHQTGSDRIYEAVTKIDPDHRFDVVINLQGDLPRVTPESLKAVMGPLQHRDVDISTLGSPIVNRDELTDPNVVKIALELRDKKEGQALYFSRSCIPVTQSEEDKCYHHIGIYAYRREALERFVKLPPSLLEKRERLEQLRALSAGMRIDVALVDVIPQSVDTAEDLEKVRRSA